MLHLLSTLLKVVLLRRWLDGEPTMNNVQTTKNELYFVLCVVCRVCIMYYVVCCKGLSLVADKIGYSMKGSAL